MGSMYASRPLRAYNLKCACMSNFLNIVCNIVLSWLIKELDRVLINTTIYVCILYLVEAPYKVVLVTYMFAYFTSSRHPIKLSLSHICLYTLPRRGTQ